jgi:hypothetical protein
MEIRDQDQAGVDEGHARELYGVELLIQQQPTGNHRHQRADVRCARPAFLVFDGPFPLSIDPCYEQAVNFGRVSPEFSLKLLIT